MISEFALFVFTLLGGMAAGAIALGVIALLVECGVFAGLGLQVGALVAGAALLAVACVLIVGPGRQGGAAWLPWVVLALVFCGMAIGRYAFYMI